MTRLKNAALPVFAIFLLLFLWQIVVTAFALPTWILPTPTQIFAGIVKDWSTLGSNLTVTLTNTLIGFAIGAAIGLVFAIAMKLSDWVNDILMPISVAISSVPHAAFVPLALIWFGLGAPSKIAMAALAVSFSVLLNAVSGLEACPPEQVALLRSFGAKRLRILWKLELPAALPSIMTGLRIGLSRATITVIVTEMLGAYAGIGQTIYQATSVVDYVTVWAAVFLASAGSLILYGILTAIDAKFVWWR